MTHPRRLHIRDDLAYLIPMGIFLLFVQVAVWWPGVYVAAYVAKTVLVTAALILLWPHYTKIRWNHLWLGAAMGVVGIVQWIGTEKLLLHYWPNYPHPSGESFNPFSAIHSPSARWSFIAVRWAAASLMVPVMEELFWRDFLWRTLLAPNDFKLAEVGERDWTTWLLVSGAFCLVHPQWITAIGWGLMIGGLLMYTRSLGACIIMHGVTNFLLGLYVLKTGDWYFW